MIDIIYSAPAANNGERLLGVLRYINWTKEGLTRASANRVVSGEFYLAKL